MWLSPESVLCDTCSRKETRGRDWVRVEVHIFGCAAVQRYDFCPDCGPKAREQMSTTLQPKLVQFVERSGI